MDQYTQQQANAVDAPVAPIPQEASTVSGFAAPARRVTGLSPLDPKFRYNQTSVLKRDGSEDPEFFRSRNLTLDDSFFESFTSYHLRTDNVPVIVDGYNYEWADERTSIPLYDGLDDNSHPGVLTEKSLEGPSGQVLAFRKLVEMNKSFALAEMREEMSLIRAQGTTNKDQMARIRKMLVDFG
jgi:hypothetical protein